MKTIQVTENYEMFKKLNGQRKVYQKHVDEIKESIEKFGWICDPIRLTKNHEVFDGQHRLAALMELGMPVEYIVIEDLTTEQALRIINNTQRPWGINDYTESYSDTNKYSYSMILSLCQKYGVSEKVILRAANRTITGGKQNKQYKNGEYSFGTSEYLLVDERMPLYCSMRATLKKHKGSDAAITSAIFFLMDHGYDVKAIEQAEMEKGDPTVRLETALSVLEYLENMYNKWKAEKNRIYPSAEFKKTCHYKKHY